MCTTTPGPLSISGASWFRSHQLQMSLKYWYAWTAVFFSSLASWAASVTGYWRAHPADQYHPLLPCQCKEGPIPKPCWLPAGSVTTFPFVANAYQSLLCPRHIVHFTELLHTYLNSSVTSRLVCIRGIARTQLMPCHSMGTLRLQVALYPGPAQLSIAWSTEMQKQLWGSGGMLPQKLLELILRLLMAIATITLNLERFYHAFATSLRMHSVGSL